MRKSLFIIFIAFLILQTGGNIYADIYQLSEGDITAQMIPSRPRANQQTVIRLTSYVVDLDSSNITWIINGKNKTSGKGIKNFTFTTGSINTATDIEIDINTPSGQYVRKNISFKPTDVDLIWQSESYVPPFYKGKAMFSFQNKITYIAMPHMSNGNGGETNPKNLIYKWTKDGSVVDYASGYGKNTFTFTSPIISRAMNVTVEVTSPSNNDSGFALVDVNPIDPTVLMYRINPLYGIEFQNALTRDTELKDSKEIVIIGIPFYFGTTNTSYPYINYKWSINGAKINNDQSENVQVFRSVEGVSGASNISLSVENTEKVLQYTTSKFNLKFGDQSTQNTSF